MTTRCTEDLRVRRAQLYVVVTSIVVQVNGVVVTLPYRGPCYTIDYSSNFVSLDSNYGLSVQFDGNWLVVIQVPDDYQSLTHGLCGNNNGNADDDFTLSNGTYVGNLTDPGSYIGNSYVVPDGNDTDLK
jgi:von Willebrand factor type D domain